MITTLTLKNVTSYDNISGVTISDLKKVNYFFGFNGSGKSTIAKYLTEVSDSGTSTEFQHCLQTGYDPRNHQLIIFDEIFIENNFNRSDNLKGVFSLNETNDLVDREIRNKQLLIENLTRYNEKKNQQVEVIENDKNKSQNDLVQYCWSKRATFSTFSKFNLIYSGSKVNHLQHIRSFINEGLGTPKTIESLKKNYDDLYETELKEITENVNVSLYKKIRQIENSLSQLLDEVIVGNEDVDIAALIKVLDNKSWIEIGINYIDKTDVCPFCQETTITENLRQQFNDYFDNNYKEKISLLNTLVIDYKSATNNFLYSLRQLQNAYNPQNLVSNTFLELQDCFSANITKLEEKIAASNEKKDIMSILDFKNSLVQIIGDVKTNNGTFEMLDFKRKTFEKDIWNYISSDCKTAIEKYDLRLGKYQRINALILTLTDRTDRKIAIQKADIEVLRGQTVDTRKAVENINIILKNTGFQGFEIDERNTVNNISQYYLKRPGSTSTTSIFKSLSEGEKNFISFLYFYQLCIGTDDIQLNGSKKKIIVIDDPVSSLDNQALFVVSTLIHNLITQKGNSGQEKKDFKNENLAQVFILTHNLYFYKEVSFNRRPTCTDFWHYNITKINNITSIHGEYNKRVHDDYSLLWDTLKTIKSDIPENQSLNIVIANTMRRVLESYVNFIGYGNDSWATLSTSDQNDPSYYIKSAFISLINDESHKTSALDGIYYHRIVNERPEILFDVFRDIFSTIGREHYEMMMLESLE